MSDEEANLPYDAIVPATKTELDLFDALVVQTAIKERREVVVNPLATLDGASTIEFVVSGSGEEWMDPSETYLVLDVQVASVDNRAVTAAHRWGPVNNVLHSMFEKIEVQLNNTPISHLNNLYPYVAYITSLLNYSDAEKKTSLAAAGWIDDTSEHFDSTVLADNVGLASRAAPFVGTNRVITYTSKLHCDLFQQGRLIPNAVDLKVRLSRGKDEFCVMDSVAVAGNVPAPLFRLRITRAELKVDKVRIADENHVAISRILLTHSARIIVPQVAAVSHTVSSGTQRIKLNNLFLGHNLPERIVVAMVLSAGFNGSRTHNPFNLQHFNARSITVSVDGDPIPTTPLKCNFTGLPTESYVYSQRALNQYLSGSTNGVTLHQYANGSTFWSFDLSADKAVGSGHFYFERSGSLGIEIDLTTNLTDPITVIVLGERQKIISIDGFQNVTFDMSS